MAYVDRQSFFRAFSSFSGQRWAAHISGELPILSFLDEGTAAGIRAAGIELVSAAALVQRLKGLLDEEAVASHERAAWGLYSIVDDAWQAIDGAYRSGRKITEGAVRRLILEGMERRGLETDHPPIVAAGAHSGDPTTTFPGKGPPSATGRRPAGPLGQGTNSRFNLRGHLLGRRLRQECRRRGGRCMARPGRGRDEAVRYAGEALRSGLAPTGASVDERVRSALIGAGYGDALRHRTGHGIDTECHGSGVNLDSIEFPDRRLLLEGACFSVEPGLYFQRFGLRTEIDVYIRAGPPDFRRRAPEGPAAVRKEHLLNPVPVPEELLDFIREGSRFLVGGTRSPTATASAASCPRFGAAAAREDRTAPLRGPFKRPEIQKYAPLFVSAPIQDTAGARAFIMDCSNAARTGDIAPYLAGLPVAVVDHHASGEAFGDVSFIDVKAPSVTFMTLAIIEALGLEPTKEEAELLLFGLCTDTGFFRHVEADGAETMEYAARLMRRGASPKKTFIDMNGGKSLDSRILMGIVLSRVESHFGGQQLLSFENLEETERFGLQGRDSDALYQLLQAVSGVRAVVLIRQETAENCTVGLRSGETWTFRPSPPGSEGRAQTGRRSEPSGDNSGTEGEAARGLRRRFVTDCNERDPADGRTLGPYRHTSI
jgi:phosphoesterase RecJ-like protein